MTIANLTPSQAKVLDGSSVLATRYKLGTRIRELSDGLGALASLTTQDRASLVGAVNEVVTRVANAPAGLDAKNSVLVATTAALPASAYANGVLGVGATLTATANGALPAQDGVTVPTGSRLLVKNQVLALQNGIYAVTSAGGAGTPWVLTRATDCDSASSYTKLAFTFVEDGTAALKGSQWAMNATGAITIGVTALTWAKINLTSTDKADVTNGGVGNAGKLFALDANGKAAGLAIEDLPSTANGKGAALIGIEDAAALFAGVVVEAALAEAMVQANAAVANANTRVLKAGDTMTGQLIVDTPNATPQARLVPDGASATPPAAGTAGDLYLGSTGILYVCTTTGNPATWVAVAVRTGTGYATLPINDTTTGTASGVVELFGSTNAGNTACIRFVALQGSGTVEVYCGTGANVGAARTAAQQASAKALDIDVSGNAKVYGSLTVESGLRVQGNEARVLDAVDPAAADIGLVYGFSSDGLGLGTSVRAHRLLFDGVLTIDFGTGANRAGAEAALGTVAALRPGGGGVGAALDLAEDPANGTSVLRIRAPAQLTAIRTVTFGDEDYALADIKSKANTALQDATFAGGAQPGVLERTGAGTYVALRVATSAGAPNKTHNAAAGYPDWSRWRDTQSAAEWIKVGESGGNAQWERAASRVGRAALLDNQPAAVDVGNGLSWPLAAFYGVLINFGVTRGSANSRVGTLRIAAEDNTDTTTLGETSTEIGATGVTLSLAVAAGVVKLQYTSTNTGTAPRFDFETREFAL